MMFKRSANTPRRAIAPMRPRRDLSLDVLRLVALHLFVVILIADLPLFPWGAAAMVATLAVSGSLMAQHLERSAPESAGVVLWARLRRVLLPLWAFGIILVPLMLREAYRDGSLGTQLPGQLWAWVLPLMPPPVTPAYAALTPALPYLTAHVVLVALSPALLWLVKRWPKVIFTIPVVIVLLLGQNLIPADSQFSRTMGLVSVFAGAWLVGLCHHSIPNKKKLWQWTLTLVVVAGVATVLTAVFSGWDAILAGEAPVVVTFQATALAAVLLTVPRLFGAQVRMVGVWTRVVLRTSIAPVLLAPLVVLVIESRLDAGPILTWAATWVVLGLLLLTLGMIAERGELLGVRAAPRRGRRVRSQLKGRRDLLAPTNRRQEA